MNPAISDWIFHHRIQKFTDAFMSVYLVLQWFEWKHSSSPHVHGLTWLSSAPNAETILASPNTQREELIKYVDNMVSTTNPAVSLDWSNAGDAPLPMTNPNICNKAYNQSSGRHTKTWLILLPPVGNSVGKVHEMYPSVVNSLTGLVPATGHITVGGMDCGWSLRRSRTECLMVSCRVLDIQRRGQN